MDVTRFICIRHLARRKKTIIFGFSLLLYILIRLFTPDFNHHVPGWESNVSRNSTLYVNPEKNTLITSPKFLCRRTYLLIIIHSAMANTEARMTIRNTWANKQNSYFKSLNVTIEVAFILGKSKNDSLNTLILDESSVYGDIIQEEFIDTYNNLTIKTIMMLKWVIANCRQATFIMKTDDDVCMNVPLLVKALKTSNTTGLLMGHVYIYPWLISDPERKWYVPNFMFWKKTYTNFIIGSGYVMSLDVVLKLYVTALTTPIIHLEDVYLTGVCAYEANLTHINHPGFGHWGSYLLDKFTELENAIVVCCDNSFQIYQIWNKLRRFERI